MSSAGLIQKTCGAIRKQVTTPETHAKSPSALRTNLRDIYLKITADSSSAVEEAAIKQWIDYVALVVAPALQEYANTYAMIEELNDCLATRSFLTGSRFTVADAAVFTAIREPMSKLLYQEQAQYINVVRWYIQVQELVPNVGEKLEFPMRYLVLV